MNVLSLFDGMSCGRLALERAGIKIENYFASEIDKYAIQVAQANYPDTIQLGDITEIKFINTKIDLLLAGSPCQGFSKAGKGLNFDDPRSKLFFEFVRLLKYCRKKNPDLLFLLENVDMLQEWQDIISKAVGIQPIKINSSLVSAQNRVRLYWTNIGTNQDMFGHEIPAIPQPKDLEIILKDILENEVEEKYYLSESAINRLKTRHKNYRPQINPDKTGTLLYGNQSGKNTDNGTTYICHTDRAKYDFKDDGKSYSISTREKNIIEPIIIGKDAKLKSNQNKAGCLTAGGHSGGNHSDMDLIVSTDRAILIDTGSMGGRVYDSEHKSTSLNSQGGGQGAKTGLYQVKNRIRRLTPIEYERLQGVPDNYTNHVSNSQRYKMLGNGWQIDTIAHIFSYL